MILYNTTFILTPARETDFLDFMRRVYLPALQHHGSVSELRLHRIQPREGEEETRSFALHFYTPSQFHLQELLSDLGLTLAQRLVDTFGEEVIGFSTIMHTIDHTN